jgi:PIN domain nuclease of toxin-antitoxin system
MIILDTHIWIWWVHGDLTPQIAIASTQLVNFHRDPADQIITATAKVYDCPLVTMDTKIIGYADVTTIS